MALSPVIATACSHSSGLHAKQAPTVKKQAVVELARFFSTSIFSHLPSVQFEIAMEFLKIFPDLAGGFVGQQLTFISGGDKKIAKNPFF